MVRGCSQTAPRVRVSQQRLSRSRRRSRPCLQLFHGRTTGAHLRLLTPTGPCSTATRLQGRAEILTNQLLPRRVCGGECFPVRQPTIAPTAGHSSVTPQYDNPPATPRAQQHDRTTRPSAASTPHVVHQLISRGHTRRHRPNAASCVNGRQMPASSPTASPNAWQLWPAMPILPLPGTVAQPLHEGQQKVLCSVGMECLPDRGSTVTVCSKCGNRQATQRRHCRAAPVRPRHAVVPLCRSSQRLPCSHDASVTTRW